MIRAHGFRWERCAILLEWKSEDVGMRKKVQ